MSAEQNMAMIQEVIWEAFNNGNYDVLGKILDPNFIENQFGLHTTIKGVQGDIQFLRKAFPDFKVTIEDMVANGDRVVMAQIGFLPS